MQSFPTLSAENPLGMMQNITQKVIYWLEEQPNKRHVSDEVYDLIERLILPYVDFSGMARWVAGRNAWNEADNVTKKEFTQEFKTLLVKNYAQFLMKFSNEEIEFLPLREATGNKKQVQVKSLIIRNNSSPIHVDYYLILQNDRWMIYDMVVEGSSLLQGYKTEFADDIQNGGIEAAIDKMHSLNNR
jgi:phospholipid transport system substrate-binding protein